MNNYIALDWLLQEDVGFALPVLARSWLILSEQVFEFVVSPCHVTKPGTARCHDTGGIGLSEQAKKMFACAGGERRGARQKVGWSCGC